jgi:hypothetical protein
MLQHPEGSDMNTTTTIRLTHVTDPAHGWVMVGPALADEIGLTEDMLTRYSYVGPDGTLYAEEDCDAAVVIWRVIQTFGSRPVFAGADVRGAAPCRSYRPCRGARPAWEEAMRHIGG